MTRRFVSAKRLIRYFSNSSKLVEHRAQSPIREVKMLAVWPLSLYCGWASAVGLLAQSAERGADNAKAMSSILTCTTTISLCCCFDHHI